MHATRFHDAAIAEAAQDTRSATQKDKTDGHQAMRWQFNYHLMDTNISKWPLLNRLINNESFNVLIN